MKRADHMKNSDRQSILVQAALLLMTLALASSLYVVPLDSGESSVSNTRVFTLIAENWGYNQTQGGPTLRAVQGEKVTITLIVPGELSHNLRIKEYGILIGGEFGLRRGQNQTVSFIADKLGIFEYDCKTPIYGGHAELGMKGTFMVTQPEEE